VAQEKQVVLGRHGERVPHERRRVDDQGAGHGAGDPAGGRVLASGPPGLWKGRGFWNWEIEAGWEVEIRSRRIKWTATHSSGLFCVSMTAAMGIPKFDTGPQKSAIRKQLA
jgi:hypothetical protein